MQMACNWILYDALRKGTVEPEGKRWSAERDGESERFIKVPSGPATGCRVKATDPTPDVGFLTVNILRNTAVTYEGALISDSQHVSTRACQHCHVLPFFLSVLVLLPLSLPCSCVCMRSSFSIILAILACNCVLCVVLLFLILLVTAFFL